MEPHPIPQNVTSFQFHLVGDMTLKQFIYLAVGAGTAYFLFVFLSPIYPIVAWPLIIISALLGVAFAFLPISSRPLDYWVGAFLRAIYSPTKRMWAKNGQSFKDNPLFNSRLVMYFSGAQTRPVTQPTMPTPAATPLPSTPPTPPPPLPQKPEPAQADLPTKDELGKIVDLARQAQSLQFKTIQTERTLNQIKTAPTDQTQINKVITDLNTLVTQASAVKQQLDQVTKPEIAAVPPAHLKETIKVVVPPKEKQTQVALTTFPNVINGIVKDKNNNYLEAVVAVIYDKEGLPVRALKTNKLGQFTGSTPLPNGTYTLELEKDNFSFDVLQIELTGEVLPPLLITTK